MIPVMFVLTLRQLLRQRRTLLLVLLAVLPVLLALLFRLTAEEVAPARFAANGLFAGFIVNLVLPLTALVVGTAALGQEIEDGTVVYLLGKPLPRWTIVIAKVTAAWAVTGALVVGCVVASGLIALTGEDGYGLTLAFVVAVLAGSLTYSALFVGLSIRFGRALIIGLAYVFVWEALVSRFIPGVRFLSVRAYTLGVADGVTDAPARVFEASLSPGPAALLLTTVTVLTTVYAIRRLNAYEVSERV